MVKHMWIIWNIFNAVGYWHNASECRIAVAMQCTNITHMHCVHAVASCIFMRTYCVSYYSDPMMRAWNLRHWVPFNSQYGAPFESQIAHAADGVNHTGCCFCALKQPLSFTHIAIMLLKVMDHLNVLLSAKKIYPAGRLFAKCVHSDYFGQNKLYYKNSAK